MKRAFSLIELIIVLTLCALLTMITLRYFGADSEQMESRRAQEDLRAAFAEARFLARLRQETLTLNLEPSDNKTRIQLRAPGEVVLQDVVIPLHAQEACTCSFYPDGEARPSTFTLISKEQVMHYRVQSLTGELLETQQP